MFKKRKMGNHEFDDFTSDIILGRRYRNTQNEIEGIAVSIHFYQHACERVTLEVIQRDGKLEELTFDAPLLQEVGTKKKKKQVTVKPGRTGGPGSGARQESSRSATPSR